MADKKTSKTLIDKKEIDFTLFYPGGMEAGFIPFTCGTQGKQAFIKLKKGEHTGLFYTGEGSIIEAEIHRAIMKLINDGWERQGEVLLEFDGRSDQEKEMESAYHTELITVELGRNLLPLVDPNTGAPLLDLVSKIRKDLALRTGVVIPGIRIKDNMHIPFDTYVISIKEVPVISGEAFLDRLLAVGESDKLSQLKGWAVKEPVLNINGLWLEPDQHEKAEALGLIIFGPLNVIATHIADMIRRNLPDFLGLQDVARLVEMLMKTHPIIAEDFVKDKKKLRIVQKILKNLAAEQVSIRDLPTIIETIGAYEDDLDRTDFITEMVRRALARQICWSYVDMEGKIVALTLSRKLELKIKSSIRETKHGIALALGVDEADAIIKNLRKTLEDFKQPQVIFCDPETRLYFRRLTEHNFPNLGILSTAEIVKGIKIEILGEVELPEEVRLTPETSRAIEEKEKKSGGLFGLIK